MRPHVLLILTTVLAASSLAASPVAAATYVVDCERSELVVRLFKAGLASGLAHEHVVHATRCEGEVTAAGGDPDTASVEVTVFADGLRADEPELRRKYDLSKPVSEGDRRKIQENMEGGGQLDVQRYPEVRFESTSIEKTGEREFELAGRLTLHGTTRSVTFPATAVLNEHELHADGSFEFLQSDYGIEPYSVALGTIRNEDRVRLVFHVRAALREDGDGSPEGEPGRGGEGGSRR